MYQMKGKTHGHGKSCRILKLLNWFKSNGDFTNLGNLCKVVELHWGGSATNWATPSSSLSNWIHEGQTPLSNEVLCYVCRTVSIAAKMAMITLSIPLHSLKVNSVTVNTL